MPLTNCSNCRYFDRHPNHSGDLICAVNPCYTLMWQRLNSLDTYTLNSVPVDSCRDFELHPDMVEKEVTLSLTVSQWQLLAVNSSNRNILDALKDQTLNLSLSLTVKEWQRIGNRSTDERVTEQLISQGIELDNPNGDRDGEWIEVNSSRTSHGAELNSAPVSSCIDAIAFSALYSTLKIRFHSGQIYEYEGFNAVDFQSFCDASSKGRFFNRYIKDLYPYRLIA